MKLNIHTRLFCIALACVAFSSQSFAQADCDVDPVDDTNNDGFNDQFVSPLARIENTEIDCSLHNIQAGAILRNADIFANVTIEPFARVLGSNITFEATIKSGARILNSGVDGFNTVIGESSVVRNGSFVGDGSVLARGVVVDQGFVDGGSLLGDSVVVRNARVRTIELQAGVQILDGANVTGDGFAGFPSNIIRRGTVVRGAIIFDTVDIGENCLFDRGVTISAVDFIGSNMHVGANSSIGPGGDFLGDTTIGQRVTIGGDVDMGANNTVGNDSIISGVTETGNGVVIGNNVFIDSESFIDDYAKIDNNASVSFLVQIGEGAIIGARSTIEQEAVIGKGAIVQVGSTVPAGFNVGEFTVFPRDYPEL